MPDCGIYGQITNALNQSIRIENVDVSVTLETGTVVHNKTNGNGDYHPNAPLGTHTFAAAKVGYCNLSYAIDVAPNKKEFNDIMVPIPDNGDIVIVLTWSNATGAPTNLNSHVKAYVNKTVVVVSPNNTEQAGLTHYFDDVDGLGPETMGVSSYYDGNKSVYYVHDVHEGNALEISNARVRVIDSNCNSNE